MDNAAFFLDFGHFVTVVKADASITQSLEVTVVGVLVEGDKGVRLVAGVKNFTRTKVNLKDGRATRNGAGNGHVGHDFLGS